MRRHAIKGGDGTSLIFMGSWMGGRTALPAAFMKEQRANELDADRVAVDIMAAAGYDPAALPAYVDRTQGMLTAEAASRAGLPTRDERISALNTAVANTRFSASRPAGDLQAIQDRVRELSAPPKRPVPSLRR
jgi:predicted Zn-dependent protease